MSTYQMVARHVEAALAEAAAQKIESEVVARYLLSEAVRVFKQANRSDATIRDHQRTRNPRRFQIFSEKAPGTGIEPHRRQI